MNQLESVWSLGLRFESRCRFLHHSAKIKFYFGLILVVLSTQPALSSEMFKRNLVAFSHKEETPIGFRCDLVRLVIRLLSLQDSYLVDPASSHMLVTKTKPCMSKYKLIIRWNCEWLIKSVIVYLIVNSTWITVGNLGLIHAKSRDYL